MRKAGAAVPFMDRRLPNPEDRQAHFSAVRKPLPGDATVGEASRSTDAVVDRG
ncbi:hypothetical protein ACIO8H_24965 [Streptomyces sp. NPDC087226]|jgi:hypothetical protein|uniref:hypothetical protein n=1 Tax=Streptomyces sp. NPDC087226 TaxID=3365771 RepID=UPI00382D2CBD